MRTGCPWRDLPEEFGRWNTVFKRFNLWSKNGVFELIFNQLSANPDPEWLFIDGSIVRAHQHSTGAASQEPQGIGKSRGGNTTKIHLVVDSGGLPVHFELSAGQIHDMAHAERRCSIYVLVNIFTPPNNHDFASLCFCSHTRNHAK